MPIMEVWVDDATASRMRVISREKGRQENDLAATAISEAALSYFRHRTDDPASAVKDDDSDYYRPDASGYSRADEEWFFDMDGKP